MIEHGHVEVEFGVLDGLLGHDGSEILPLLHDSGLVPHRRQHNLFKEGLEDFDHLSLRLVIVDHLKLG